MTTLDKTALEAATAEWLNWTDRTAGEGLADHLARAITAYLDALSSLPAQAAGVRLVPLEPTQEMINAGLKRNAQNPHPWLPAVYRAMIAIAPSQPAAVSVTDEMVELRAAAENAVDALVALDERMHDAATHKMLSATAYGPHQKAAVSEAVDRLNAALRSTP